MATDARPYQARRSRQCTRSTPLTIGMHSLDSRAFQKKGCWVFSWRDTTQKKPQGMDISLRQKGALKPDTLRLCACLLCGSCAKSGDADVTQSFYYLENSGVWPCASGIPLHVDHHCSIDPHDHASDTERLYRDHG